MNKPQYPLHLIGNAHLDPVWLWQWQEGYAEIKATFRSALDRLKEFPDFVFTCACAAYYRWVEENAPEMFEEIRQRVAEGRWVIVGGWWIQPDCNLPSGESFVRQGLYSQRYFLEKFGMMANVGYNVDSFGHHAMLPQILKKSGLDYYVFQRPSENEKHLNNNLFWWESADGTRVLTFRLTYGYGYAGRSVDKLQQRVETHLKEAAEEGTPYMSFYGVGNHGGGPTIAALNQIKELQQIYGEDMLKFSSPKQYFASVMEGNASIPVLKDELQMHAIGCYSTHSKSKANNRKAEHRLINAEKFSTLADIMLQLPYPKGQLESAWEQVLFNQFHDIMGGCSIKEAMDDALDAYGEALNIGARAANAALQKISWSVNTMKDKIKYLSKEQHHQLWELHDQGSPIILFNPLSWEVTAPVELTSHVAGITDENGNPVANQTVRASRTNGSSDLWGTMFNATIPAMGYRLYWGYLNKSFDLPQEGTLAVDERSLENDAVRIEIDPHTGYIQRYYDKVRGTEMLKGSGAIPLVIEEVHADTWAHRLTSFRDCIGRFSDATTKVIERGPLRVWLRVTSRYNQSVLRQDFILYRDSPELKVRVQLDWREKHKMLKLSFPVNVEQPKAVFEIPYGFLERKVDGLEVPGQMWVDISGVEPQTGSQQGLALLNDSKYAYDVLDNDLRMTVVRSPVYADHFANFAGTRDELCEFMDQGIQEFRYSLVPHGGDWRESGVVKKAYELNSPPSTVIETYHEGELGPVFEGIRISADNVIASVFKPSEDGGSYILRCYETAGLDTSSEIVLPMLGRSWTVQFGKCEIKTFNIPLDRSEAITEINLIEM